MLVQFTIKVNKYSFKLNKRYKIPSIIRIIKQLIHNKRDIREIYQEIVQFR